MTLFGKDKYSDLYQGTLEFVGSSGISTTGMHACLTDRVKRVYLPAE